MKHLLSFCHIPKCAGTTFEHLIRKNIGNQYYRFSEYKYPYGNYYEEKRNLTAIGGHYNWDFPYECGIFKDREIKTITFLREPIDRAISFFYFSNPDFHKDPIKYFSDRGNGDWKYRSNTIVKFLAGIDKEPTEDDLMTAKLRLSKSYVFYQDDFDNSLKRLQILFPDIFGTIEYEYKNECKVDKKITPELIEAVKAVNGWDLRLWEYIKN